MATIPSEEKVFMVSNSTNTTYSGSASLKAMQEWYTMQDVSDTVMPYKVFTALLTQSGGDNEQILDAGFTVVKGVTYTIVTNDYNVDLSRYGAPNNNVGTQFVAIITDTLDGILDYLTLTYNTGAPVVTVLENTIGDIWFTYNDVGSYNANSDGMFRNNKVWITFTTAFYEDLIYWTLFRNNDDSIGIKTYDNGALSNDVLHDTPIEIRVYN